MLEFKSKTSGYIEEIDSHAIGEFCMDLGAGRKKKDDDINHKVGVILKKKIGDYVEVGDVLAAIHTDDDNISMDKLENAYKFSNEHVEEPKAILG